jgi:dimethylaniline monooxygenase (N-oxide forming)
MFWFVPGATVTHPRDLETLEIVDEGKLIHVNRAHPTSAKGRFLTLSTGETIATDAIVWCTGWMISNLFLFEPALADEVGLPLLPHCLPEESAKYWEPLDKAAEDRLVELYPVFKNPPEDLKSNLPISPFRLFRFVVSPKLTARGDNSLVILGNYANGRVQTTAEIISLWSVAYLEDLLPPSTKAQLQDLDGMNKDIAHVWAYGRTRFLGFNPYRLAIFEGPEFDDQYMQDLGLRADRKRMRMPTGWRGWFGLKAWYAEWFGGYYAADYKGIVQEFMATVEQRKKRLDGQVNGLANGHANGTSVSGIKRD